MYASLAQPQPYDGNCKLWKLQFEIYLEAFGAAERSDKAKICTLLNCIGPHGLQVFNTFEVEAGNKFELDKAKLE
jgi:hypothetical protein